MHSTHAATLVRLSSDWIVLWSVFSALSTCGSAQFSFDVDIVNSGTFKVPTGERFLLSARVRRGDGSEPSLLDRRVSFEWRTLARLDADGESADVIFLSESPGILTTPFTAQSIAFAPNVLQQNADYEVTVEYFATADPDGPRGTASVFFSTNGIPRDGRCTVTPTTGVAASTPFSISCAGWTDAEGGEFPLQYRFLVSNGQVTTPLTRFSDRQDATLYLSQSVPRGWTLSAEVRDPFGAVATFNLTSAVVVDPPLNGNLQFQPILRYLTNAIDSLLVPLLPRIGTGDDDGAVVDLGLLIVRTIGEVLASAERPSSAAELTELESLKFRVFNIVGQNISTGLDEGDRTNEEIELGLLAVIPLLEPIDEVSIELRNALSNYLIRSSNEAIRGIFSDGEISKSLASVSMKLLALLSRVTGHEADNDAAASSDAVSLLKRGQSASVELLQIESDAEEALFDVNRTFARDFDWTIYLVSRGSLRRLLPMEEPDVVRNEDLTLYTRKELSQQYSRMAQADNVQIEFPDDLFDEESPDVLDFSFLVYNGGIFQQEFYDQPARVAFESAHEEEFAEFVQAVETLDAISPLVRAEFYNADTDIRTDELLQTEVHVDGLSPCQSIEIRLPITEEGSARVAASETTPVCRHFDEDLNRFVTDCILDEEHLVNSNYTEALCRCTHLTFFDVGFEDFIPQPNLFHDSVRSSLTMDNMGKHPTGWQVVAITVGVFALLFAYAAVVDWMCLNYYRDRAKEMDQRFILFADGDLLQPYIDAESAPGKSCSHLRKAARVWWRMLLNYHKWVAILFRDRRSNYLTRDRVSVLFAFVMSTFAASAAFFGTRANIGNYITAGALSAVFSIIPSFSLKYLYSHALSAPDQSQLGTRDARPAFVPDVEGTKLSRRLTLLLSQSSILGSAGTARSSRGGTPKAFEEQILTNSVPCVNSVVKSAYNDTPRKASEQGKSFSDAGNDGEVKRDEHDKQRNRRRSLKSSNNGGTNTPRMGNGNGSSSEHIASRDSNFRIALPDAAQARSSIGRTPSQGEETPLVYHSAPTRDKSLVLTDESSAQNKPSVVKAPAPAPAPPRRPHQRAQTEMAYVGKPPKNAHCVVPNRTDTAVSSGDNDGSKKTRSSNGRHTPSPPADGRIRAGTTPVSRKGDNASPLDSQRDSITKRDSYLDLFDADVDTCRVPEDTQQNGDGDALEDVDAYGNPKGKRIAPPQSVEVMRLKPYAKRVILIAGLLWSFGCAFVVLLYSIDWDLAAESSFFTPFSCESMDATFERPLEEGEIKNSVSWLYSVLVASGIDIFIQQPIFLFFMANFKVFVARMKKK